ncbi:rhomboid family intramembrane serine protease [Psychrobacter sp. Cmf 22.2]|uniref:rhomboid family intramembrane serine protease n=1 Tax=Psychrobacter sp. Cmf 22.2 TaxID=1926478 RepID=UPI000946F202|nr:rhomboid family intramembrane serine protease [Psychrobacter sp. Cmf 22.2]OLF39187.1 rhomboid family intramembrane serine protease [Psychrobacter sp. Cmf 22.2]
MTIKQLLKTAPVTTLLLVSFIGLFIMQVLTGVDANNPSTQALLNWGANALPLTMVDDPWRLVSSAFLHIGLMHLLFNGFAMYFFGQVAEPMFGSAKFLVLFLLSAIGGNLLNNYVTWQGILDGTGQPGLSAGASGGIMGIGAALLIAALFKISVNGMVLNLRSLIFIMGINLVYGFAVPGIDNAGHIGGAITGLLIAFGFALTHRQRMTSSVAPMTHFHTYEMPEYGDAHDANTVYPTTDEPINTTNNHEPFGSISLETPTKPAMIWELLPWLVMLLISIGFVWWWQDIHQQILQVLKTIE